MMMSDDRPLHRQPRRALLRVYACRAPAHVGLQCAAEREFLRPAGLWTRACGCGFNRGSGSGSLCFETPLLWMLHARCCVVVAGCHCAIVLTP